MILKNIGKRLKTFRKSNGYTQEQFSELLNMSLNFYGKIERGQSRLSIEKLVLLHEKFDIDIDYLLTGTPSKNVDYNSVLQKISLITTAIQTGSSLRIADETELGFFKLQCVHIFLWIDLSCIEQKVVGRNAEQWFCKLLDFGKQKVLDVLACQNKRGLLFTHTLHAVADIFDCGHVCEE